MMAILMTSQKSGSGKLQTALALVPNSERLTAYSEVIHTEGKRSNRTRRISPDTRVVPLGGHCNFDDSSSSGRKVGLP